MNVKPALIGKKGRLSIHVRIFLVIISVAVVINVCGQLAGARFLTHNISKSMEDDMTVAVEIADQFVSKEIDIIKLRAVEAARNIELFMSYRMPQGADALFLDRIITDYPVFTGAAVFSRTALLDSRGEHPVPPDLYSEAFMQIAFNGGQIISPTMHAPDGSLVMYAAVPINNELVLTAALPGLYFHNLLSKFKFWQTGHIFINDKNGFVVSSPRRNWVEERWNFFEMARTDSAYEGLRNMTARAVSGETGTARYHIDGVLRLCAFRPLSTYAEGWFIAIVAPLIETAVKDIPGGIILTGVLTLILSVIVAFIASAILKRPYEEFELHTVTLSALFDSIPALVFTLDKNLCFTQCNKPFLEHFGLHKENLIGRGEECLGLSEEDTAEHNRWNRMAMEEGKPVVIEERVPGINGNIPLYETVKAPLILNGDVIGVLGMAYDITKRKEMEVAAFAASNSKSAFLANMSHEIRTPMNSIVGFSELMMDCDIPPKAKDYLDKIKTNADWLLNIINDILDISKIEAGKMELENIPFDMHDLFVSCRTLILPKALEKNLLLHFYAEPSMGKTTLGDPTRLRQVFINLLSNAVKFTNTGMIKLHAAIIGTTENTVSMHFEIKDSGIGMSDEQLRKIFDPFTQAETGTTRKYGGTGLGLSITRSIIELMGGELIVESAPGLGSKFSFDLTFETIDRTDDDISEKIILNEIEKPTFEGEILLCEDNAMNQEVICEHLARVGIKTVVAENGQIGVDFVKSRMDNREKQFDLIFMDMHMPVMDGLEASDRIKKLNTGIPIVAMTANIMSNDREIYKSHGIKDCVGKPFTSQELWRCLVKYFKPLNWQTVMEKDQKKAEEELRKKLIKNFARDNKNKFNEITMALETGDIKLAHRIAHTLKGNAGQLDKHQLQQAAAVVEHKLENGQNNVTFTELSSLETELKAVLVEFTELLKGLSQINTEQENADSGRQGLDSGTDIELLNKVEQMLKIGDTGCRAYVDKLRRIPGSGKLAQKIDDLDFEEALAALGEMRIGGE